MNRDWIWRQREEGERIKMPGKCIKRRTLREGMRRRMPKEVHEKKNAQ